MCELCPMTNHYERMNCRKLSLKETKNGSTFSKRWRALFFALNSLILFLCFHSLGSTRSNNSIAFGILVFANAEEAGGGDYYENEDFQNGNDEDEDVIENALKEEQKKQEEEAIKRQLEEEARRREQEFEASLQRMKDDQQRKKAIQQKKKDGKIVTRILKRSEKGQHYGVLGLRNTLLFPPEGFRIGPLVLGEITAIKIKKAYRTMAKRVHPDKNRDARASHAFRVVEESASILMDDEQRKEYNLFLKQRRQNQINAIRKYTQKAFTKTKFTIGFAFNTFRRIFGPFTVPILILGALLL